MQASILIQMAGTHPNTIGKYTVLSVLGRGGMGIVYKARDPIIDRLVAIKTISVSQDLKAEELRKRLQMEAQSAGRLQHPNIATLYDFGTFGDTPYIVMEYVEGTDLARVIDEAIPLSLPQKLDILIQIAHGLAYAHELDVVHRDMKPSNIRLTNRCVAKIIDFGLARFDSTRLTRTGFMSGTIAYMSPERIHGSEGASDDIFALGTIAYELLTATRAFPGSTPPEVMMKIISQSPPPPSSVSSLPPELDSLVMKGIARDVSDRYASAGALADALDEFRHTPALREFLSKEPGGGHYNPRARASLASTLTLPMDSDEAQNPTELIDRRADETEATAVDSCLAKTQIESRLSQSAATLVEPRPQTSGRSRAKWGAIVFAIVVVALAGLAMLRFQAADVTGPAAEVSSADLSTAGPAGESAAENGVPPDVAGQRLLLTEVRNDLEALRLDPEEKGRLTKAEALAAMAEAKFRERDYETTANLLSNAIRDLRELRQDHYQRLAAEETDPPAPTETTARPSRPPAVTRRNATPPPRTEPVVTAPPAEVGRPVVVDQPRQPDPSPASSAPPAVDPAVKARAEITEFVARLATAYERRDVAFFREHDANFNERLAAAIRNSPSIGVEMQIESIDLSGTDRAEITVVRTDRFAGRDMPPGVQRLTFSIARADGSWQILSMSRDRGP